MLNSCSLCESDKIKQLFQKKECIYCRCQTCGYVFLSNSVNPNFENNIDEFEPAYLLYLQPNASDFKNHTSLLSWIKKYSSALGNCLDIGCGSGKFVIFLRDNKIEATGIEPAEVLHKNFLQKYSFFSNETTADVCTRKIKFDIITALDVIEHVQEPHLFLSDVSTLLNNNGYFFISTPDTGSLHQKLLGKHWHYYNKYHFSLFNKHNLQQAAEKAGLHLIDFSYRPRYFSLSYLTTYWKNFMIGKKTSIPPANNTKNTMPLNLFDNMYCVFQKR